MSVLPALAVARTALFARLKYCSVRIDQVIYPPGDSRRWKFGHCSLQNRTHPGTGRKELVKNLTCFKPANLSV